MPRVRTVVAGLTAGLLLSGLAAPVAAQTTTTLSAAEAGSAASTLSIAGSPAVAIAETGAAAVPGQAAALGSPVTLGGEAFGALSVASDGVAVADEGCATPAVPAPLSALLSGAIACAEVAADGDARAASATAGVAEAGVLDLDGADLGPLNEVLATLPLEEVLAELEEQVLGQLEDGVFTEVRDQCVAALEPLNVEGILDDLLEDLGDASPEEIAALLALIDDLLLVGLPSPCEVLGKLAAVLSGDSLVHLADGDLLAALAGAEGVLSVTLLETTSEVDRDGGLVSAAAGPAEGGAIAVTLDVPLLRELLEGVLADAVAPLLSAVQEALAPLGEAAPDLPVVTELVGPLLAADGTAAVLLDGPLLAVGLLPGEASATGDLGTLETDGVSEPALVELGGTIFALPILEGLDTALNDAAAALDEQVLAGLRDSPLGELVEVTLLPGGVADGEVEGLPGTRATSGTASVVLLSALDDPLVDLQVAPAVAAVGVAEETTLTPGPEPEPTPTPTRVTTAGPDADPLPVTGAGAALFGLLALGAAGLLRRRG